MDTKDREPIGYISPEIPKVEFPTYEGESYEALVPDTLDIAERADYGIHCLTQLADPEADYEIWWNGVMNRKPPLIVHDFHDLNIGYKFQEALPLLRTVTGNSASLEVDQAWAEGLLRMQGDDGLVYMPVAGRPWTYEQASWLSEEGWQEGDQLALIGTNGALAGIFGLYYALSGDELWRDRSERLVDRLAQLMVYKEDYCYFPIMHAHPGQQVSQDMPILDPGCNREAGGAIAGWMINGLCQLYLRTGYEPALDLAGKLSLYMMWHSGCFDCEGRFMGAPHTHLHTRPISGLLEYAVITKNEEIMEYCRKAYEYAATSCGSATLGFFPPRSRSRCALRQRPDTEVLLDQRRRVHDRRHGRPGHQTEPSGYRRLLGRCRSLRQEPVCRDADPEDRLGRSHAAKRARAWLAFGQVFDDGSRGREKHRRLCKPGLPQ